MAGKGGRRQRGEGSLYQRESDDRWVWEQDLGWGPDGKKKKLGPVYGATPEEALKARDKLLRDRHDGFVPSKSKDRPRTVGDWCHRWLHKVIKRQIRATTWHKTYKPKVEHWIIPGLGRLPLDNEHLNEEAIEDFETWLLEEKGLAPATVTQIHRILGTSLKEAVVRGLLTRNPVANVTPPAMDREIPEPPEPRDVKRVLKRTADGRMAARWAIGLEAGPRQGEILGLMEPFCDLDDLDDAAIEIAWELVRLPWQHGCTDPHACGARRHRLPCPDDCPKARRTSGRPHRCITADDPKLCEPDCKKHASTCPQRHGGGLRLQRPKSEKSRRTIPISRTSATLLKARIAARKAERLAAGPGWDPFAHDKETCTGKPKTGQRVCPVCERPSKPGMLVFTQPNGAPIDPRRDWGEWTDLLDDLGLDHVRVHDGRHYAATSMLEHDVDARIVQEILGHFSVSFTQQTYQAVRRSTAKKAMSKVSEALWGDGTDG